MFSFLDVITPGNPHGPIINEPSNLSVTTIVVGSIVVVLIILTVVLIIVNKKKNAK